MTSPARLLHLLGLERLGGIPGGEDRVSDVRDVDALKRHQGQQRLARVSNPLGLVFVGSTGKAINHDVLRNRFNALTEAADLPRIRFHDLRHTAATLMLIAGEHPKVVQERLGHSTIAMTLDRYSHGSEGMQQAAAERLETLLSSGS
jgi:integrase